MLVISRQVDEWVQIGDGIFVSPTDIDAKTVRVIAKGRMIGGPDDGATFESAHELSQGQSFPIGSLVVVTAVDLRPPVVRLGIDRPKHVSVRRKEVVDAERRAKKEKETGD
jgi:sRNA-binding carbon storage regulator CsrA